MVLSSETRPITGFSVRTGGQLLLDEARLAVLNWAWAKKLGGAMALRLDGPLAWMSNAGVKATLDELRWLGVDWAGEVEIPSARRARYLAIAQRLLESGAAYLCYSNDADLDMAFRKAKSLGARNFNDQTWRESSESERKAAAAQGRKPRIRLKGCRGGASVLKDVVRGSISFAHDDYDGFVLVTDRDEPTAALIQATDDHHRGVTHVLKAGYRAPAVDTPRDIEALARCALICEAMGWQAPCFSLVAPMRRLDTRKLPLSTLRREGWTAEALREAFLRSGGEDGGGRRRSEAEAIAGLDTRTLAARSPLFPPGAA